MPEMHTIAIDCRFAATMSGLGRYTRELVRALTARESDLRYVLLVRSKDEAWIPAIRPGLHVVEANIDHYSLAEQFAFPEILRDTCADLLFSPHFNVPFACPLPFVVTIHDLILHRFPNDASAFKRFVYHRLIGRAVSASRAIIAVTDFVKGELTQTYGAEINGKIQVVHEGVSADYVPTASVRVDAIRKKYALTHPYFLYVGNAKQHKNVRLLIDAFTQSKQTERDLILVSGGKEFEYLQPLPPRVRKIEAVLEGDLPALYTGADAFVTASLYEGFCLPVAEALACGCPVVAPHVGVFPEVTQGHALLIDPTVDAFASAFMRHYAHGAPVRLGQWDKAAQETEEVLRKALR